MMPGETLKTGAAPICPDCRTDVRTTLEVKRSGAGFYVATTCDCGPYSRESEYYPSRRAAEVALESGTYGR